MNLYKYLLLISHILYSTEAIDLKSCNHEWSILWTREVGNTPFAASPLVVDVDLNGQLDIVAAPLTEAVTVLEGSTGQLLSDSHWPSHNLAGTVHASPLQFDRDGDGLMEVLLCTTQGEIVFFTNKGEILPGRFQLPPMQSTQTHLNSSWNGNLQPHVLASPVLCDLNRDGNIEELLVPVSYCQDDGNTGWRAGSLSIAKLVVVNLASLNVEWEKQLEIQVGGSSSPGLMLYSPTVADLGAAGAGLQVLVGTSAGRLHVLDAWGSSVQGFPRNFNSPLVGQVAVVDVELNGQPCILVGLRNGELHLLNAAGVTKWSVQLDAWASGNWKLADVDLDDNFDIILSTVDGKLWVLKGTDGSVFPKWPVKLGNQMTSSPTITMLTYGATLDIVMLSDDHYLHVLSADQKCRSAYGLGESALVEVVTRDLVPEAPGMEMLVATQDGTLICVGRKRHSVFGTFEPAGFFPLHSDLEGGSLVYTSGRYGIKFLKRSGQPWEISSSTFSVEIEIVDGFYHNINIRQYLVQAHLGRYLLFNATLREPGVQLIEVLCPYKPAQGLLTLSMTNLQGFTSKDQIAIRCNMNVVGDLQWFIVVPVVCLATTILFLFGFPETDLLPFQMRQKDT